MRERELYKYLLVMSTCLYLTLIWVPVVFAQPSSYPAMCAGCDPAGTWDAHASMDAQETHNYFGKWGYPLEAEDPFTSSEATRSTILSRIPNKRVFFFSGHGGIASGYTIFLAWDGYVYSYEVAQGVPASGYFFAYVCACFSIQQLDMAQAFIKVYGAGCYVGWTISVGWWDATYFRRAFLETIDIYNCSVLVALNTAQDQTGVTGWGYYGVADLVYLRSGLIA